MLRNRECLLQILRTSECFLNDACFNYLKHVMAREKPSGFSLKNLSLVFLILLILVFVVSMMLDIGDYCFVMTFRNNVIFLLYVTPQCHFYCPFVGYK